MKLGIIGTCSILVIASATACASSPRPNADPSPDPSDGQTTNPYGAAYPSGHHGYQPRHGATPGSVIRNYKFQGYPNADTSLGLKTIALADFFDPEQRKYKILHITVAGLWCEPCKQETQALVPLLDQLSAKGVVFLQALGDGPVIGTAAGKGDLDAWIRNFGTRFTEVLDPNLKNLGPFFDPSAIPWNADIDVRTMEILDSFVGFSGDLAGDVQPWVDWVSTHPPMENR